jgi:hypothetical protein
MRVLTIVLVVEMVLLAFIWLKAQLGDYRVRRRRLRCPLDGREARLLIAEHLGHDPAPNDIIRCSLLERDLARSCDRQCAAQLLQAQPSREMSRRAATKSYAGR